MEVSASLRSIPLTLIDVRPDLFQARDVPEGHSYTEGRVAGLVKHWDPARLDPLGLWQDPQTGRYAVIAGHHRLEAMKRLGYTETPAAVSTASLDAVRRLAYLSNLRDSAPNLRELGRVFALLRSEGDEIDEIAAKTGYKPVEVRDALWVQTAGPAVQEIAIADPQWAKVAAEVGQAVELSEGRLSPSEAQAIFNWYREQYRGERIPGRTAVHSELRAARIAAEGQQSAMDLGVTGFGAIGAAPIYDALKRIGKEASAIGTEIASLTRARGFLEEHGSELNCGPEAVAQLDAKIEALKQGREVVFASAKQQAAALPTEETQGREVVEAPRRYPTTPAAPVTQPPPAPPGRPPRQPKRPVGQSPGPSTETRIDQIAARYAGLGGFDASEIARTLRTLWHWRPRDAAEFIQEALMPREDRERSAQLARDVERLFVEERQAQAPQVRYRPPRLRRIRG